MTTLSTHVLDIERGVPAAGLPIELMRGELTVASAATNADGRVADLAGGSLEPGIYRLVFDVAVYFGAEDRTVPFLKRVSLDFEVNAENPHYHVPLLLSRYACTAYRGS